MLRPAYLLPDARLLPRLGLSIPRSGRRNLFRRLGPAIRCFGAYRLGTLTRWRSAASVRELRLLRGILLFRVTTHHAETLRGVTHGFHLRHTHETFYYQRRDVSEAEAPNLPLATREPRDPAGQRPVTSLDLGDS